MLSIGMGQMLEHVLNHDDRAIHQHADCHSNAAQRHQVGRETEPGHDHQRNTDGNRY